LGRKFTKNWGICLLKRLEIVEREKGSLKFIDKKDEQLNNLFVTVFNGKVMEYIA